MRSLAAQDSVEIIPACIALRPSKKRSHWFARASPCKATGSCEKELWNHRLGFAFDGRGFADTSHASGPAHNIAPSRLGRCPGQSSSAGASWCYGRLRRVKLICMASPYSTDELLRRSKLISEDALRELGEIRQARTEFVSHTLESKVAIEESLFLLEERRETGSNARSVLSRWWQEKSH